MKTKFNGILTLLLAFVVQITFAQEKTISGTVSDENGPLPGVSVLKKGTSQGVESDFDGNYTITAKAGDILIFSFVGMQTVEKMVGNSSNLNVIMKASDDNVLEEVVVTGYGIKREKQSLGYSQQSVGGDALVKAKETDISNALAGKVSGVQITGNTSSTFGNSKIRLRGEDEVLYIVDGIRVYSTSDINTENIADISVLKGASATAIYGPDGRNGVVLITTKSAKNGESTISLDVNTSIGSVSNLPEYQNEYGGGYSQEFNTFTYDPSKDPESYASFNGHKYPDYNADESWGPRLDGTPVRHWDSWIPNTPGFGELRPWSPTSNGIESFFNDAPTNLYTLAFAKGGDGIKVRTTLSYLDAEGVMPNSERTSAKLALNVSYDLSEKLKMFAIVNYEDRKTKNNPDQNYGNLGSNMNQWWQRQLDFERLKKYERNGLMYSWNIGGPRNTKPLYWDSPYVETNENTKNQDKNSTYGKLGLTYVFNDNIDATFEARRTFHSYKFNDRATTKSLLNASSYTEMQYTNAKNTYFGIANYKNKFSDDMFDVTFSTGFEIIENRFRGLDVKTNGGLSIPEFYNLLGSSDAITYSNDNFTNNIANSKRRGVFFKGSLGYKGLAYFDGSYRFDYSSTANPNDNKITTYGLSGSLLLHKILPKNNILTFSKVRIGYANAPYFPDVYRVNSVYEVNNKFAGNSRLTVSNTQENPNLKGGIRGELEFGTELKFIKNRLSLDVNYFIRKDRELPVEVALDGATGYSNITINSGQSTSKGIEVSLFGDVVKTEDFTWNLGFNFATLNKTVDELFGDVTSRNLSTYTSNLLLQERVGYDWGLLYGTGFARHTDGSIIFAEKSGGNYQYSRHRNKFLGNLLPDYTGGITTNFSYKNFDATFGFEFQKGGKFYSRTERYYNHSGLAPETAGLNDKGNPKRDPVAEGGGVRIKGVLQTGTKDGVPISDGTVVDTYVNPKNLYGLGNLGNIYENNLHDASYIKLRTIRLNYTFGQKLVEKVKLSKASLGLYANNVWLINSDLPWVDPSELEKRSGINWAENGQLPMVRTIGVNLNLTF